MTSTLAPLADESLTLAKEDWSHLQPDLSLPVHLPLPLVYPKQQLTPLNLNPNNSKEGSPSQAYIPTPPPPASSIVHNKLMVTLQQEQLERLSNQHTLLQSQLQHTQDLLQKAMERIQRLEKEKVDRQVVEELMRHVVTRPELKKTIAKRSVELEREWSQKMKQSEEQREELTRTTKVKEREELEADLIKKVVDQVTSKWTAEQLKKPMVTESPQKQWLEKEEMTNSVRKDEFPLSSDRSVDDPTLQPFIEKLHNDVDEKLFMLSTDVEECRQALSLLGQRYEALLNKSSHPAGQWLWTQGSVKWGSLVAWTTGVHHEHLHWHEEKPAWIRIRVGGLYQLRWSFFTRGKPTVQLEVDGHAVMTAIHSPSYTVNHPLPAASRDKETEEKESERQEVKKGDREEKNQVRIHTEQVTGCSWMDVVCLPTGCTLAVHYQGPLQGTVGYMELKRLY